MSSQQCHLKHEFIYLLAAEALWEALNSEHEKEKKTQAPSLTRSAWANELPRTGDHTVNDSGLFFVFCEEEYNFKISSSYSNPGFKHINYYGWRVEGLSDVKKQQQRFFMNSLQSLSLYQCAPAAHSMVLGWWVTYSSLWVSIQLCALCLWMSLTWSSRGKSQKAGMYLAHSTNTKSCCFMDSHTSVMVATFLVLMSPLSIGAGEVIYTRESRGNIIEWFVTC